MGLCKVSSSHGMRNLKKTHKYQEGGGAWLPKDSFQYCGQSMTSRYLPVTQGLRAYWYSFHLARHIKSTYSKRERRHCVCKRYWTRNRTRDLMVSSQELWPPSHEAGPENLYSLHISPYQGAECIQKANSVLCVAFVLLFFWHAFSNALNSIWHVSGKCNCPAILAC